MKTNRFAGLVALSCLASSALANEDSSQRWRIRADIGGNIPISPTVSEFGGPVTGGGKMELDAGVSLDFGIGFKVAPWFILEGEIGFTYNNIDAIGNWSYPNSSLTQMPIMLNAEFCLPLGRLVPFAGIGGGGVLGSITFGNYYYYYYSESDGWGNNFAPAAQAFAGLRYEISNDMSLGLSYRFLAVPGYNWDVEWWNGADFSFGVDKMFTHSICVTFNAAF